MQERTIDNEIKLIPYYRNDAASFPWYQNSEVVKQADNRDEPYTLKLLHNMYDYLSTHGICYHIETRARWSGMFLCSIMVRLRLWFAKNIRINTSADGALWIC